MLRKKVKTRKLSFFIMIASILSFVPTNVFALEKSYISDYNLRREINKALNLLIEEENIKMPESNENILQKNKKRSETQKITLSDLSKLIHLDAINAGIKDISGLENAVNLESLNLDGNEISNISSLGKLENLKRFSIKNQNIKLEEKNIETDSLSVKNPLVGIDKNAINEMSGENIKIDGSNIRWSNLSQGLNNLEATFSKEFGNGVFSGKVTQNVNAEFTSNENDNSTNVESIMADKSETNDEIDESKEPVSLQYDSGGKAAIGYTDMYDLMVRYSAISTHHKKAKVKYNPDSKQLKGEMYYRGVLDNDFTFVNAGASSYNKNAELIRRWADFTGGGRWKMYRNVDNKLILSEIEWGSITQNHKTGDVFSFPESDGDGYWSKRTKETNNIKKLTPYYQESKNIDNTLFYRILADGMLRGEGDNGKQHIESTNDVHADSVKPHGVKNNFTDLGLEFEILSNNMILLTDSTTKNIPGDKSLGVVVERSGSDILSKITIRDKSYYEAFKDLQGITFKTGDKLRLIDFNSGKEYSYIYNASNFKFENKNEKNIETSYAIDFKGDSANKGYTLFIDNNMIKQVTAASVGSTYHGGWSGQVLHSIAIFNSNDDLRGKATMMGVNHTISDSAMNSIDKLHLKNGDTIVIYAVKSKNYDESAKIRIQGDVLNSRGKLNVYEAKPYFNETVFRYNNGKLEQIDGTIANMNENLKLKLGQLLDSELGSGIASPDKKAHLQALDSTLDLRSSNLSSLNGLEYAINTNGSLLLASNRALDLDTINSLRNLIDITYIDLAYIDMSDINNLTKVVKTISKLGRLDILRLAYCNLEDISPLSSLINLDEIRLNNNKIKDFRPLDSLYLSTANCRDQSIELEHKDISIDYNELMPVLRPDGYKVTQVNNINPNGTWGDGRKVYWTNISLDVTELSFEFYESLNGIYEISGTVRRPVTITGIKNSIELRGRGNSNGYNVNISDNGEVNVRAINVGNTIHSAYNESYLYSAIAIYDKDSNLKGSSMLRGTDIVSKDAPINKLSDITLVEGDFIALYYYLDNRYNESSKMRILGPLEGDVQGQNYAEFGPGKNINEVIFKYTQSGLRVESGEVSIESNLDNKLNQIILGRMDLDARPDSKKTNYISWLQTVEGSIDLRSSNLISLNGLEYAINANGSLLLASNKALDFDTINSLRNLKDITNIDLSGIDMSDIKNLTKVVNTISKLRRLDTLRLTVCNLEDISPLSSLTNLTNLDLNYNRIRDFRPLKNIHDSASFKSLTALNQTIELEHKNIGTDYDELMPVLRHDGYKVTKVSNINPTGIWGDGRRVYWTNLSVNTRELSFDFNDTVGKATISGHVTRPVTISGIKNSIELRGSGNSNGYNVDILEQGGVHVKPIGKGNTIHSAYNESYLYSAIAIYDKDSNLKGSSMLRGTDIVSKDAPINKLSDITLVEGDFIALYYYLDNRYNESSKMRILGPLEGDVQGQNYAEFGPGKNINEVIFKYTQSGLRVESGEVSIESNLDNKLNQIILGRMDLDARPDSKKTNYISWLQAVESSIDLNNLNLSNLSGMEYCINTTGKLNLSNNSQLDLKTVNSVRNLHEINNISFQNIDLSNTESFENIISVLAKLKSLNGLGLKGCSLKDITPIETASKIEYLDLSNNGITNISPIKKLNLKELYLENQEISLDEERIIGDRFVLINPIIDEDGNKVNSISNIIPSGEYRDGEISWTGLSSGKNDVSFNFSKADVRVGKATATYSGIVRKSIISDVLGAISIPSSIKLGKYESDSRFIGSDEEIRIINPDLVSGAFRVRTASKFNITNDDKSVEVNLYKNDVMQNSYDVTLDRINSVDRFTLKAPYELFNKRGKYIGEMNFTIDYIR